MLTLLIAAVCSALGIWTAVFIRKQRLATEKTSADSHCYRAIVDHVGEGILVVDAEAGRLVEANPTLLRKLGYSIEELRLLQVSDVLLEAQDAAALNSMSRATTLARTTREVLQRARDGSLVPVDISATALEYAGRPAICYVIRDATPRKVREDHLLQGRSQAELRAEYLASRDPLTGLANRQSFKDDLQRRINGRKPGASLAVLLLDLNDFSTLNDTLGAKVGDAVLLKSAERLRKVIAGSGSIARMGNDEFAVTLQPAISAEHVARMAVKLQTALAAPMLCFEYEINVTANIGISLCGPDDADADTVLSHADLALSTAKSHGRGNVRLFNSKMDGEVRRRLEILLSLKQALDRDELCIHYQPVIDIQSRKLIGLEALVRWEHPQLGHIPPSDFILAAEQSDLIIPLGERVLRLVCEQIVRWRGSGVPVVPIAVNVSAQQFQRHSVAKLVQRVLDETGAAATDLAIEITETSLMSAVESYANELQALRAIGLHILVDDFGTGYSSLSYLKHLPIDILKIDCSFVANVHTSSTDEAIVGAILAMARSLGLKVIAEGVESQSQLDVLSRHGCQMAQGYFFSYPLPAEMCGAVMRTTAGACQRAAETACRY
nr:bifunctional diguanylate cyclase/phosphodiesterase [uncultured Steroidobacter sp.]